MCTRRIQIRADLERLLPIDAKKAYRDGGGIPFYRKTENRGHSTSQRGATAHHCYQSLSLFQRWGLDPLFVRKKGIFLCTTLRGKDTTPRLACKEAQKADRLCLRRFSGLEEKKKPPRLAQKAGEKEATWCGRTAGKNVPVSLRGERKKKAYDYRVSRRKTYILSFRGGEIELFQRGR